MSFRTPDRPATGCPRLLVTGFAAAVAGAALLAARPEVHGNPWAWNGDAVARVACWAIALASSCWLAVVCFACAYALHRQDRDRATRFARFAPAFVRRLVEATLLVTCLAATAPAAHAATSPEGGDGVAPPTVVVRIRPDGMFAGASVDEPVVRAPASDDTSTTMPTIATRATTTTTTVTTATAQRPSSTTAPTTVVPTTTAATRARVTEPTPRSLPRSLPRSAPRPAPTAASERIGQRPSAPSTHVVRPGDNLWTIARDHVIAAYGHATDREIAQHWRRIIDANRAHLRSSDPSLIYAGEIIALPPIAGLP